MYGTVTKICNKKGFGFIRGEDGKQYFIHKSKMNGEYLAPGYYVFFKTFCNSRSDYNAKDIVVIEACEKGYRDYGKNNK